jgi:anti-anti-sigma factor
MRLLSHPLPNDDERRYGDTSCDIAATNATTIITISGELDHYGVTDIGDEVRGAVRQATGPVVIDCARLGFVDSSGLRLLVEAETMAEGAGRTFVVRHPSAPLRSLLRISGLDEVMTIELDA